MLHHAIPTGLRLSGIIQYIWRIRQDSSIPLHLLALPATSTKQGDREHPKEKKNSWRKKGVSKQAREGRKEEKKETSKLVGEKEAQRLSPLEVKI